MDIENKVNVEFVWVADEVACIRCPICKAELTISIYDDNRDGCCGKKYKLHQQVWVTEVVKE